MSISRTPCRSARCPPGGAPRGPRVRERATRARRQRACGSALARRGRGCATASASRRSCGGRPPRIAPARSAPGRVASRARLRAAGSGPR
ncbi:hypothetical protein ACFPRL_30275 [Pseudoclavibacter helvolus]